MTKIERAVVAITQERREKRIAVVVAKYVSDIFELYPLACRLAIETAVYIRNSRGRAVESITVPNRSHDSPTLFLMFELTHVQHLAGQLSNVFIYEHRPLYGQRYIQSLVSVQFVETAYKVRQLTCALAAVEIFLRFV